MELVYFRVINAAIEWAANGEDRRAVIEFAPENVLTLDKDTKISVWCCDRSKMAGAYIRLDQFNPDNPVQSIENSINREVEEKEREMLKKLKLKYESGAIALEKGGI